MLCLGFYAKVNYGIMSSKHIEKIEQKSLLRPLCKLLKFRDTLIVVLLPTGAKTGDLIEDSKT